MKNYAYGTSVKWQKSELFFIYILDRKGMQSNKYNNVQNKTSGA